MEQHQLINQDSGNVEWFSPTEIIEAARKCLCVIELDPFSCAQANLTVKAEKFFTQEDDGFDQSWTGKRVWCNHPFSRENNARIAKKANWEYLNNATIVMITFAATSEKWFQPLLKYPQCFLHGRTNYLDKNGNKVKGVTKGSVVTYLGDNEEYFYQAFKDLGTIKVPYGWR